MDEFSDFQMAVQKPLPKVVNVSLPYKNGISTRKDSPCSRFSDSSPVHSLSSHNGAKAESVRCSQFSSSSSSIKPLNPAIQKFGTSVGSRLANYDLGLSVPLGQSNGFQGNGGSNNIANTVGLSSPNPSKTINNPVRNNNQDLLIGEEDKYSALRMLIETDMDSSTSVFENSYPVKPKPEAKSDVQMQLNSSTCPANTLITTLSNAESKINSNSILEDVNIINHSSSTVNSNLMCALQNSTTNLDSPSEANGDSSSDFGDFQSFAGFVSEANKENGVQSQQSMPTPQYQQQQQQPSNSLNQQQQLGGLMDNFQSFQPQTFVPLAPLSILPPLQKHDKSEVNLEIYENGASDSDAEFGDFVSVEPVLINQKPSLSYTPVQEHVPTSVVDVTTTWNNQNFDLSSLTTSSPSPKEVKKDPQNATDEAEVEFQAISSISSVSMKNSFQNSSSELSTDFSKQTFTEDDINNVVLGQGLDWETSAIEMENLKSASYQPPFLPSLAPSSFIRTSLIRNDEVTDIDPVKWNQSVAEDSNNDCALDYNTMFDKKDFSSSIGKSKFLDVSPETRSIASLDLGSYVSIDYSESGGGNNNNNTKSFMEQPILLQHQQHYSKSNGTSSTPPASLHQGVLQNNSEEPIMYDEYDKYQCFREECENENERCCSEWGRCLKACKALISKAFSVFNSASTSEVIREVVSDEKGYTYVINVYEIYRISQRIQNSAEKVGIDSRLRNVCLEINNLWETLTAFLLGTCVLSEICQELSVEESNEPRDPRPSCGVCLCDVNTSQSSQFLDYGGKIYHCKCANFWVNEVDAILPSLSYVSNATCGSSGGNQQQ